MLGPHLNIFCKFVITNVIVRSPFAVLRSRHTFLNFPRQYASTCVQKKTRTPQPDHQPD